MAVPCVKNLYGRTYFDEFMSTCLMGAVFLRHSVCGATNKSCCAVIRGRGAELTDDCICGFTVQGRSRSLTFAQIEITYDFLLVTHRVMSAISNRFRDIAMSDAKLKTNSP